MKLRMVIAIIFAGIFLVAENLFAGNGDLIVNGNLGVGTTTPAEKAEVNGNIAVSGTVKAGAAEVSGNTIVNGNLGVGTATPAAKAEIDGNMVVNGNMGVGTNSPSKKLHVEGDAYVTGKISGATYGYGGMYSTSACYGCRSKNPFTDDCSCPPGFTAQWLQQFPEGNCGWYTGNMYVCYK